MPHPPREPSPPRFGGFSDAGLALLRDLARNNERPWFDARKATYREEVDAPFQAFVATLARRLAAAKVPMAPDPRKPTFRIYRDVRFGPDKRPYKTAISAALKRHGDPNEPGDLYVSLSPAESFAAAGFYRPEKDALLALRTAIVAEPRAFARIVAKLERGGAAMMTDDTLVRVPPAFRGAAAGEIEPYLKLKSFAVRAPIAAASLRGPELLDDVTRFAEAALPLLRWGWTALGVDG